MTVLSLKDYAKQHGVSYEAVRQQVVRYARELDGHIVKDGRTQYLDEDAVALLDEKRAKNPITVIQQDRDEELQQLRQDKEALLVKLAAQSERIDELHTRIESMMQLQIDAAATQLALEAAQSERDAQAAELQQLRTDLADARMQTKTLLCRSWWQRLTRFGE